MEITQGYFSAAPIFPDYEYLNDYQNSDFGSLISSLMVNSIVGCPVSRIGNTSICVECSGEISKGDDGIEELKRNAVSFKELIVKALENGMESKYEKFYKHFLKDFEENGLHMPVYGKII